LHGNRVGQVSGGTLGGVGAGLELHRQETLGGGH
jgi:hypothetical protein